MMAHVQDARGGALRRGPPPPACVASESLRGAAAGECVSSEENLIKVTMLLMKEVSRQISSSRLALSALRQAQNDGAHRPELLRAARLEVERLNALMSETDRPLHWKMKSLIYEFEALMEKLET